MADPPAPVSTVEIDLFETVREIASVQRVRETVDCRRAGFPDRPIETGLGASRRQRGADDGCRGSHP
jgi:hypothetical protein